MPRRLDELQIGLGAVELRIPERQERNVRGVQRRCILLIRGNNGGIPHTARELLCIRLQRIEELPIRDDAKIEPIAMTADRRVERRHQRLPVRTAVECAEEDRDTRALHIVGARLRQFRELVLKEVNCRRRSARYGVDVCTAETARKRK